MGLAGLTQPVELHSSREDNCTLTPEQCAWRGRTWIYWYKGDIYFGHGTVYFVVVLVGLFALAHIFQRIHLSRQPKQQQNHHPAQKSLVHRIFAALRYLSYRVVTIQQLGWYSPAIGVVLLGCAAWVYFGILTLGPKPYYWPNTDEINYGNSPPIATRTGWMAVALMPFTVASAAKWNFITVLTGISHERLQVFHRWSSWLMFVLALIHTFPFIIYHIQVGDMVESWNEDIYYWTGVAALIPQAWLNVMSIGYIRNRYYESFKATHYIIVTLFIVFFFLHCNFRLSSWDYFIALVIIYGLSLLASWIKAYGVNGFSHRATFQNQSDGTVRISIPTRITWRPGQHIFLRFPTPELGVIHSLTTHPFSICALPESNIGSADGDSDRQMVFYVRAHRGITQRMHEFAKTKGESTLPVHLDGPYGGLHSSAFNGFGKFLFIAGGSGAGAMLPLLETVVRRDQKPTAGTDESVESAMATDVHIVWVIRENESLKWFREAVRPILAIPSRANVRVSVHVTRQTGSSDASDISTEEKTSKEDSKSATESESETDAIWVSLDGKRPDLPAMIRTATSDAPAPVAVAACGPSSMLYDVRNAAAAAQVRILSGDSSSASQVWLHTENFGW